jgi:dTDP-L-rhamnose 4-epimerase
MRKVLVTGGAGFIGSHTVDSLLRKGYEVRVLDNLSEPVHKDGRTPDWIPKNVEFRKGDVRNRKDMERALRDVQVVFHLAAHQDHLTNFSQFFDTNTVGTSLLYELIVESKLPVTKIILASSQAVYGEGKYFCPDDGVVYPPQRRLERLLEGEWGMACPHCKGPVEVWLTDEGVMNPHNSYAISKCAQELIALNLGRRYRIPTVALRYSITVGPRQSFHNAYSGACRIFTMRTLAGKSPLVYEDGLQLRDYVHIEDVVSANLLALGDSRCDNRALNVGGGKAVTVLELARLVLRSAGGTAEPILSGKFRVGDTRHAISDVSALRALGWKPRKTVAQAVEDYVDWARRQEDFSRAYEKADRIMLDAGVVRSVSGHSPGN